MDEARRTQEMDSTGRLGVRRRAARALVANYIYELSSRHAGIREPHEASRVEPPTEPRGG
jgi:hypothetical protein